MRRGVKIALIISIVVLILIGIAIPIYFNFMNKNTYFITRVEKTEFTSKDFVENSNLQLNKNGTFHVNIAHKEKGLSLTGIGTYTVQDKTYHLHFTQAYARDNEGNIVDYTTQSSNITCMRVGNRIKFTDHKYQIFYFG